MNAIRLVLAIYISMIYLAFVSDVTADSTERQLEVKKKDSVPEEGNRVPEEAEIDAARKAVEKEPKDRGARFALVQLLQQAGRLEEALAAAEQWREVDAYNLVVVRLIGDLQSELNRPEEARRVYSAVVELLPKDAQAHRALATVLKQQGDVETAYLRLKAAAAQQPDDLRLAFELADAAARKGTPDEALERFSTIITNGEAPEAIVYPARQISAQLLSEKKRERLTAGDSATADDITRQIKELNVKGGAVNDIKIFLTWDTDGSDVDLWVINPAGEKIFYSSKRGQFGGELFHDVTTGYGPESFTATTAHKGTYKIQVNYYGTNRSAFREARGEVVIVTNEGRANQVRTVLPYRLFTPGQTVSVAEIEVK